MNYTNLPPHSEAWGEPPPPPTPEQRLYNVEVMVYRQMHPNITVMQTELHKAREWQAMQKFYLKILAGIMGSLGLGVIGRWLEILLGWS